MKWNLWRSAVAGALIGLVEATGLAAVRPSIRRPLRVVRPADRPCNPLSRFGVWFVDPLPDPRPPPSDLRCRHPVESMSIVVPRTWPIPTDC